MKHLRESLHEAHRELAIKAERIEQLSSELKRLSKGSQDIGEGPEGKGKKTKKVAQAKKEEKQEPVLENVVQSEPSNQGDEICQEPEEMTEPLEGVSGILSMAIFFDQNSAVNFEGREKILRFVEENLEANAKSLFSVRAFANDSTYSQTTREIASNRARFLVDYLAIRGISPDAFSRVVGEISGAKGREGRKVVVELLDER